MGLLAVFQDVFTRLVCLPLKKAFETPVILFNEENKHLSEFFLCGFTTGEKASGHFETHDVEETER